MKFKFYGETYNLFLVLDRYVDNNNIAVMIWDENEGPFADLTVNIAPLPEGYACIDTNNFREGIDLIKKYNLGEPIGQTLRSGFCEYPVYKFNMDNIKKYVKEV